MMLKKILSLSLALFGISLLSSCSKSQEDLSALSDSTTNVKEEELGAWIPSSQGPWNGALYSSYSQDGLTFEGKNLVLESAGVPNLLVLQNGDLILTYQYFSSKEYELFDTIAYSRSTDEGETWSTTQALDITGLPEGIDPDKKPMDPTLIQLEDGRFRLYFTYHAKGNKTAALYTATTQDSSIDSHFVVEDEPALITSENLLDPAVVYFNGLWHHFTWRMEDNENYHSVSEEGVTFTREDDINLKMDFLGQVIPFEDGLRFYGTSEKGVSTAFSNDGYTWEMDQQGIAPGADPAVQKLDDGRFLMVYTSMNFNQ